MRLKCQCCLCCRYAKQELEPSKKFLVGEKRAMEKIIYARHTAPSQHLGETGRTLVFRGSAFSKYPRKFTKFIDSGIVSGGVGKIF